MPRGLLIFALCLPLAVLMGFMLSDPLMGSNMAFIGVTMMALLIPVALAVHHRALVWMAGAYINAFFLPGQPQMWMLFAGLSFGISVLSRPLSKVKQKPVWDRAVLMAFTVFMACVAITAVKTGGIGMKVIGSAMYGGRKYIIVVASFIGFLALSMAAIPRRNAQKDVQIYTLAPITGAFGNFAYMLGPAFYFLFLLFPVELVLSQASADFSPALVGVKRYAGFGPAGQAVFLFCILRWGIRGVLRPDKFWRLGIVAAALSFGLLSGFRSTLLLSVLVGTIQFFAEGLYKTRYALGFVALFLAAGLFLAEFSERLPLVAQRAISFLPMVKVDQSTAAEAKGSVEWRVEMWHVVIPEIPNHLWFGKGYIFDPADMYFAVEAEKRGFGQSYDAFIKAGDYHNGPLSVIVPFGVIGATTFLLFILASLRCLWRNMRNSDPDVLNINRFLFSLFTGKLLFFLFFFGALESDLWVFASCVAVSCCVNGGSKRAVRRAALKPQLRTREEREALVAAGI